MSEVEGHYGLGERGDRLPHPTRPTVSRKEGAVEGASARLGAVAEQAARAVGDARDKVTGAYGRAADWAGDGYEAASRNVRYAQRRSFAHIGRGRSNLETFVEENPVMVGDAGLAVGLLVGALLPGTRRENQAFGQYADEVRAQGLRYAQDVAQQGRQIIEDNVKGFATAAREQAGTAGPR